MGSVTATIVNMRCFASLQLSKSNTPPWLFFMFFKLYKWYQIAQRTTYYTRNHFKIYINLLGWIACNSRNKKLFVTDGFVTLRIITILVYKFYMKASKLLNVTLSYWLHDCLSYAESKGFILPVSYGTLHYYWCRRFW